MRAEVRYIEGIEYKRVNKGVAKRLATSEKSVYCCMVNDCEPYIDMTRCTRTEYADVDLIYKELDEMEKLAMAFMRAENCILYYNSGNTRGTYIKWFAKAEDVE